jgi:hypothetical protein
MDQVPLPLVEVGAVGIVHEVVGLVLGEVVGVGVEAVLQDEGTVTDLVGEGTGEGLAGAGVAHVQEAKLPAPGHESGAVGGFVVVGEEEVVGVGVVTLLVFVGADDVVHLGRVVGEEATVYRPQRRRVARRTKDGVEGDAGAHDGLGVDALQFLL